MLAGVLIYLAFAHIALLAPTKPVVHRIDAFLTPALIFMQLLLTFCKVNPRDFSFRPWHFILLTFQLVSSVLVYVLLRPLGEIVAQGAMVCLICPTATAAAVITDKLGGNAGSLVTYTFLVNILAAVFVPIFFPIVNPTAEMSFLHSFLLILSKVFPLLICPFLLAQFFRFLLPAIHSWLRLHASAAFYIWAVALAMVMGKTAKSICDHDGGNAILFVLAVVSLAICAMQFALGKYVGTRYNDRISGGQALGQKNTVLAIWMSYTYLLPVTSVAPGAYVLWQNIINSYQLWKRRKKQAVS
ncbi:MAG: transporter [Bacteroidales bacterium]|jgi:BASS family bile acid:Na+ symporter|nr:transporter [Bacteroidales bacterium]